MKADNHALKVLEHIAIQNIHNIPSLFQEYVPTYVGISFTF